MILGKIAFILISCGIEYLAINEVLDYFHDKRYAKEDEEYQKALLYVQNLRKEAK